MGDLGEEWTSEGEEFERGGGVGGLSIHSSEGVEKGCGGKGC